MKTETDNSVQDQNATCDNAVLASGRVLKMTLKRKWYDMISSGEKTEEYREIKPYWTKRFKDFLVKKPFDYIIFKNGYDSSSPEMKVELLDIGFGISKEKWAGEVTDCYVLYLGKVIWDNALR